jgi:hypothetical protein
MKDIFRYTYEFLMFLSRITGFSYKEINIIIWFIIIPLTWVALIDEIRGQHYFKIGFSAITVIALLVIKDFSVFSNKLFDISAEFLRGFDIIGSNYTASSVIICLVVPLIVYIILIRKAFFKRK